MKNNLKLSNFWVNMDTILDSNPKGTLGNFLKANFTKNKKFSGNFDDLIFNILEAFGSDTQFALLFDGYKNQQRIDIVDLINSPKFRGQVTNKVTLDVENTLFDGQEWGTVIIPKRKMTGPSDNVNEINKSYEGITKSFTDADNVATILNITGTDNEPDTYEYMVTLNNGETYFYHFDENIYLTNVNDEEMIENDSIPDNYPSIKWAIRCDIFKQKGGIILPSSNGDLDGVAFPISLGTKVEVVNINIYDGDELSSSFMLGFEDGLLNSFFDNETNEDAIEAYEEDEVIQEAVEFIKETILIYNNKENNKKSISYKIVNSTIDESEYIISGTFSDNIEFSIQEEIFYTDNIQDNEHLFNLILNGQLKAQIVLDDKGNLVSDKQKALVRYPELMDKIKIIFEMLN